MLNIPDYYSKDNQEIIDKLSDYKMKDFEEFFNILYNKEESNGK